MGRAEDRHPERTGFTRALHLCHHLQGRPPRSVTLGAVHVSGRAGGGGLSRRPKSDGCWYGYGTVGRAGGLSGGGWMRRRMDPSTWTWTDPDPETRWTDLARGQINLGSPGMMPVLHASGARVDVWVWCGTEPTRSSRSASSLKGAGTDSSARCFESIFLSSFTVSSNLGREAAGQSDASAPDRRPASTAAVTTLGPTAAAARS